MKQQDSYKAWLQETSAWCPLFGEIPLRYLGTEYTSFQKRCLDIIAAARSLWGVDALWLSNSWPEPKEVEWYPEFDLKTARGIYNHVLDIFGASGIFNPDKDPDQIKPSEILWHARDYSRHWAYRPGKDVEDYKVFSVFSIYLAWRSFKEVLSEEETSDSPQILKRLLFAETFLSKAQKGFNQNRKREDSARGGRVLKRLEGIMLATQWALKSSKNKGALSLWKFLKRELGNDEKTFGKVDIGFDENKNCLFQIDKTGKGKEIRFRAFQNYVRDIKK